MKDLREFLHFYIGCEIYDHFNDEILTLTPHAFAGYMEHWDKPEDGQIKPLLRPISSLTIDEFRELVDIGSSESAFNNWMAKRMSDHLTFLTLAQYGGNEGLRKLCKWGIDIFWLIPDGIALDKTTWKKIPR